MGEEYLFNIFLDDNIQSLKEVILYDGINGLMRGYESWLYENELIDQHKEMKFRDNRK